MRYLSAFLVTCALALPAAAAALRVDVTVTSTNGFSGPTIRFTNLSDSGYQVTRIYITNGFIDFVNTASVTAPAGGTANAQNGTQLSNGNPNDGCNAVDFATTSFDTGEFSQFDVDPEPDNCSNAVYDWRTRLNLDSVVAGATFTGPGLTSHPLSGSDWAMELINPLAAATDDNQLYRLTLQADVNTIPEPSSAILLLSAGVAAAVARARNWRLPRQRSVVDHTR